MTKRQHLGFTLFTCGLAALSAVACSSSGDESNPLATGTGGAAAVTGTGGASSASGGALGATGGSTSTATGGAGSSVDVPANSDYTVGPGGFVTSGSWTGYAWVGTEDPSVGSTISPANFETVTAGTKLCVTGIVAPETDYKGVAMLGVNVQQPVEGGEGSEGVWTASGSGIEYAVENNADSPLRIQIQGALGYPDEAWCADASDATGQIPWATFNKQCWDNKGTYYDQDGTPPLESIMFLVPGSNTAEVPFDFCVVSVGPY